MKNFLVTKIGTIRSDDKGMRLELEKRYAPALNNIDRFSHLNIIWWFSECDNEQSRKRLVENSPYKNAPSVIGTFATRSPERPQEFRCLVPRSGNRSV